MISFKWRHFKQDIILMLVRWYVGSLLIELPAWGAMEQLWQAFHNRSYG